MDTLIDSQSICPFMERLDWLCSEYAWDLPMIDCDCKFLLHALSNPGNMNPTVCDIEMSVAEILSIKGLLMV